MLLDEVPDKYMKGFILTSLLLMAICPGGGAGSACDGRETDLPQPIFNSYS